MNTPAHIGLRFTVPLGSVGTLREEMAKGSDVSDRSSITTLHLDTEARHLTHAGLEWQLQRDGRRWIQTLKSHGIDDVELTEHEYLRPGPEFDAAAHAGTALGVCLHAVLRSARQDGVEVAVRSQTEGRRMVRRVRTRGAVVEITFDQGRILAGQDAAAMRRIRFRLVSGSTTRMLGLVERWRKRHALLCDPRSDAERGEDLIANGGFPLVRKAARPLYRRDAAPETAFACVLDECLSHMTRNAVGLCEGSPDLRVEHVHQLRVSIRRLRSALRSFRGWAPPAPAALIEPLRSLFAALGEARDADVLDSGVMAELQRIGAPTPSAPVKPDVPQPVDVVRSDRTQQLFLAWLGWRLTLDDVPVIAPVQPAVEASPDGDVPAASEVAAGASEPTGPIKVSEPVFERAPPSLRRRAARRLHRWHALIVADWKAFDELDVDRLHALRKRIKRQRYAVEFFAPALKRKDAEQYLKALAAIQERMGELNDLFVAQARYQAIVEADPTAWFALGWLTARIEAIRVAAKPDLARLAKSDPPK